MQTTAVVETLPDTAALPGAFLAAQLASVLGWQLLGWQKGALGNAMGLNLPSGVRVQPLPQLHLVSAVTRVLPCNRSDA